MLIRNFLAVALSACVVPASFAQVVVRAPFVRVEVGGPGVAVRAPFVNLFVPSVPPPVVLPPGSIPPPSGYVPPGVIIPGEPPRIQPFPQQPLPPQPPAPMPLQQAEKPLTPKPADPDFVPPAPKQMDVLSLEAFAKSFQGKAGNYEITLKNPISGQPNIVRFSLPGTPQRVLTRADEIEFVFGPLSYVKIKFDRDGVMVISR
jgi:hypothetical protein